MRKSNKVKTNKWNLRDKTAVVSGAGLETVPFVPERRFSLGYRIRHYWEVEFGHIQFRLMDLFCLSYVFIVGVFLVFFHQAANNWPKYVLLHVVFFVIILEVIRLGEKYPRERILWVLRTFFPVVVIGFSWSEMENIVRMFYGSWWATDVIINLDKTIFGVHPTVWFQNIYQPWLDELMNFFYAAYYLFLPVVSLSLFIKKKKKEALAVFSVISLTYLGNYLLFLLFPAKGPQTVPFLQALQINQSSGYIFAEINRIVQSNASVLGAAFPSSHVSGSLVWALLALRYIRPLGYVMLPISLGVAVATVYLGYHHALDPVFGALWGLLCYSCGITMLKKRKEDPAAH